MKSMVESEAANVRQVAGCTVSVLAQRLLPRLTDSLVASTGWPCCLAKGVPLQVKAVVGVAWLTTLLVCCIVPIDVYSTLASKNPEAITILWDLSFWATQLLTWALIPVYMGYVDAGEFTWGGKMMASIKFNALFFVLMVRHTQQH